MDEPRSVFLMPPLPKPERNPQIPIGLISQYIWIVDEVRQRYRELDHPAQIA